MSVKKHIPNLITCCNLLCGCVGIVLSFNGHLAGAGMMIMAAALFDFFDGFAARALHAYSAIGKDLDSLADVVSFGVLPGVIVMQVFIAVNPDYHLNSDMPFPQALLPWIPCLIPVFSALRLAKFNNDPRQTENFIGLPVPANGLMVASLPFIVQAYLVNASGGTVSFVEQTAFAMFQKPLLLSAFVLIMCFLLVSELPLFSLKFKSFELKQNIFPYLLIVTSALLLLMFRIEALPLIIILYVLLSAVKHFIPTSEKQ
ncbi:MAG: CDP-alcohol phosphatidyltransferase family protein [Bacteroidetes bacterium]|jgi:CDP-diacylglycerol--serine O-phosphatidyltransferase|nr:CDP-alcohol phosphatidyltransferase family protein [Bacteroidota bacterium]